MKWFRLVLIPLAVCLFVSLAYAHRETCPTCGGKKVIPGPVLNGIQSYYGCPQCGGSGGGGAPGTPGRGWIEVPDEQPSEENTQAADTEAARQAAEAERKHAVEEQQRKFEEEQKRGREEFERIKQEALASMKGFHEDDGLGLKGVGSSNDLGLKGVGGSQTDNLGLKGMDDSSLRLKDAVADSGVKTLFEKKGASRDLLSTHAHGITALDRAASILQGAATNPLLVTSLEQAKAEADGRFSTRGKDAGQFNTVVLGDALAPDNKPVPVPPNVAIRPTYQRVVIEREEIDKQVVAGEQNLKTIEADPSWMHNQALVRQHYDQANALVSLRTMSKYDSNLIANMVNFPEANFDESIAQPSQEKHLDKGVVPSPSPRAGTP